MLSLFGSSLTSFGLSVWVYQQTGSPSQFGFIIAAAFIPIILLSPIAGTIVDRYDRRKVMLFGDLLGGLSSVAITILYLSGLLEIWHIFVAILIGSAGMAFQIPAYSALIPQMVKKEYLLKANGLVSLAEGIAQLIAPAIAGLILSAVGFGTILVIDSITLGIALVCLLRAKIITPRLVTEVVIHDKPSINIYSFFDSIRYLWHKPALLILLLLFATNNFIFGVILTLLAPYMLGFANPQLYGLVLSIGTAGMVASSFLIISTSQKIKNSIVLILIFNGILGFAISFIGTVPNLVFITIGLFIAFFCIPFIDTPGKTIVQNAVPQRMHGRIFALRNLLEYSGIPFGAIISGILAEGFFDPAMRSGGILVPYFGWLIGFGEGRGIALLFLLCGLSTILTTVIFLLSKRFRNVENSTD